MDIKNRLLYSHNHLNNTIADLCDWVFIFKNERKLLPVDYNVKRYNFCKNRFVTRFYEFRRNIVGIILIKKYSIFNILKY